MLAPVISYAEPEVLLPTIPPGLVLRLRKPNMRRLLVERLQQALALRGFSPGEIDGAYGQHTAAAVHAFQLTQGLLPDGEAGKETLKAHGLK